MTPSPPPAYGPYSPLRQAGSLYFVSGQVGVDPVTKSASPGIREQTAQALSNLQTVLETAGLRLNNVIKTTIFLVDINDLEAMNEIYLTYFSEPRPARSTVAVAALPSVAGATTLRVEIEAVAAKG